MKYLINNKRRSGCMTDEYTHFFNMFLYLFHELFLKIKSKNKKLSGVRILYLDSSESVPMDTGIKREASGSSYSYSEELSLPTKHTGIE